MNLLETKHLNFEHIIQYGGRNTKLKKFFLHNYVVTYYIQILSKFHENILSFEFTRDKKPKFWATLSIESKMADVIRN